MEYEEIQSNELEALKAIYAQDFTELESHSVWNQRPSPRFSIRLRPSSEYEDSPIELELRVTMTQTYPKTLPQIEIIKTAALSGRQIETLKHCIERTVKELKGSEMIFEVTSNLQSQIDEWARFVSEAAPNLEEDRLRRLRIEEHKQKEQQDALQRDREAAAIQEERKYDSLILEELKKSEGAADSKNRPSDDLLDLLVVPESTPGVITYDRAINVSQTFSEDNVSAVFRQVMTGLKIRQPFFGISYLSKALIPGRTSYENRRNSSEKIIFGGNGTGAGGSAGGTGTGSGGSTALNGEQTDIALLVSKVAFSSNYWRTAPGIRSLHELNNELSLVREFRHPGVVPLFDFTIERFKGEQVEWELTLLLPLSRLTPLTEILDSADCVNLKTAQRWSYQILETLESLHKAGLRHKCVCPENLMINVDPATGETSILLRHPQYLYTLFQLNEAHPLECDSNKLGNSLRKLIEENAYRTPPEGRNQSKVVSPSSKWDIWQFGAMLTEMVAGKRELEGFRGDPDAYVRSRRGHWPNELIDMLLQVLNPDPSKRPGALELLTDQFFRSDFESYIEEIGSSTLSSTSGSRHHNKQPSRHYKASIENPSPKLSSASYGTNSDGTVRSETASSSHEANATGSYGRRRLSSSDENRESRYKQDFDEGIVLGRGGFGQVVKARNKLDGRVYAVKKIRATPSTLSHILQEVVLLSRLNHQYVVRYYTVWLEDELDDGGDERSPDDFVTATSYEGSGVTGKDSLTPPASAVVSRQVSRSSLLDSLPSSSLSHFSAHHSLSELDLPSASQDFMSDSGFIEFGYSDSDEDALVDIGSQSNSKLEDTSTDGDDGQNATRNAKAYTNNNDNSNSNSNRNTGNTDNGNIFNAPNQQKQLREPLLTRLSKVTRKTLYIQMEYCENHTLGDLIRQNLYKNPHEYWRLLRQILEALSYIHGEGVIHRDLKPKNIFIDQARNIKIGDFGLARSMVQPLQSRSNTNDFESSSNTTSTTANSENTHADDEDLTTDVGTSLYAAVEITGSEYPKRGYNEKVDIFSLGIIFFEMIWKMDTEMERIQDIRRARMPQIELPSSLVARKDTRTQVELIRSMLNHDPSKRPSAMGLLKSGRIPVEEQNMTVQEALRNIRDPQIVQQLANALFSRPLITAQQVLYDRANTNAAMIHRRQQSRKAEYSGCLTMSYVVDKLRSLFYSHGAVDNTDFRSRLFPRSALYKGPTVVELLDAQGTVLQLPHDLTLPHARRLAEIVPEYSKAYAVDTVYRDRLQNPSVHPATHIEVDFDMISVDDSEDSLRFDEAETIAVMYDSANTALNGINNDNALGNQGTDGLSSANNKSEVGSKDDFIVIISHHDILSATLSQCGLSPPQYFAALSIISAGPLDIRGSTLMRSNISAASLDMLSQFGFRELLSRSEARMSRLMPLSERVRRGLAHIKEVANLFKQLCATNNDPQIYFSPLIHSATAEFYINGVMFQLVDVNSTNKPPRQFNVGSILAAGGRYDSLIKSFRNSVLDSRTQLAKAVGFGMSADKLATMVAKRQIQQSQTQSRSLVPPRCQVLVSSLSESSLKTYGIEALKTFWRHGISADMVRSIVATEDLIAQAIKENVNLVVIVKQVHSLSSSNKTFKPFRVRRLGINGATSQPDVDLALPELLPFIQTELGINSSVTDMEPSSYIPNQNEKPFNQDYEMSSDRVIIINESGKLKGGRKNKWQLEERSSEARVQFLSELGNAPIVSLDLRDEVIEAITTVSPHAIEEWKRRVVGLSPNQKAYILTVQAKLSTEASKTPRILLFSSKTENVFVYNY